MIQPAPDGGILLAVRVIPRAARSGLAGTRDGSLLVRVHAPPVDDAANAELVRVIARALDVPKSAVSILTGGRSRRKQVHVSGIDRAAAEARLRQA